MNSSTDDGSTSLASACRRWVSSWVDAVIGVWIVGARVFAIVAGFGFLSYLALRPFRPALSNASEAAGFFWPELSVWPGLIANSLIVTLTASLVSLIVGLPLGLLLFRTDLPGRRPLATLLFLPACLPVFVSASGILAWIGVRPWDGNAWMAGLIHGWLGIPWAALQLGLAYRHIDGTLEEAAALDAGWARVCLRFDLRLVLWSLLAVVVLQAWLACTEVAVTDLLAVRTFAEEVYATFQLTQSLRAQSLVVVPYAATFLVLVLAVARAARSADVSVARLDERPPQTIRLKRWRWPLSAGVGGLMAIVSFYPALRLVREVGSLQQFVGWARAMRPELANSSLLAAGGGALLLLLVMGAGEWASERGRGAAWLRVALVLLLAVPTPCLAIALKEMVHRPGPLGALCDSQALPILGQVLRWLPLGILAAAPGWAAVSLDLRDAARLDGCNLSRMHRCVYWPVAGRFLAMTGVVMVILILGELTAGVLLSPPGALPLSVRFFTLAHYGLQGQAAAVCLLIMLVMVVPWAVLVRLLDRSS